MSNHRTRRQTTQLKNHTDAPSSPSAALKDPPEALPVTEKPDALEHYKVEDRIRAEEMQASKVSGEIEQAAAAAENIDGSSKTGDGPTQPRGKKEQTNENGEKRSKSTNVGSLSKNNDATENIIDPPEEKVPPNETSANEDKNEESEQADPGSKTGLNATSLAEEKIIKEAVCSEKPMVQEIEKNEASLAVVSKSVAAVPIQRPRTRSASSAADKSEGKEHISNKGAETPSDSAAAAVHPVRRHRTRSSSSAAPKAKDNEPVPSTTPADVQPIRRHRTRSTSSAMSSISGDSHGADTNNALDDDGKTPLIANRRSKRGNTANPSQGPVRKRHKGRALFNPSAASEPSLFQDGLLANESEDTILANLPRSRSNTIDSFRAAMDSTLNNEMSESVVLPEMKTNGLPDNKTKVKIDAIDFKPEVDFLVSPRGRSDTIDFLTAAVGNDIHDDELAAPPSPIKITGDPKPEPKQGSESDAKAVRQIAEVSIEAKGEIAFGKTPKKNNLTGEPTKKREPIKKRYRTRSLSFADEEPTAKSKYGEVDEDDIATASVGSDARTRSNTIESFNNALKSSRSRSDTIDFLTAAVAGDMGHDLDAAMAAAAEDGASFAVHPISAPSGASASYQPNSTRSRSNTLDSNSSSVNSSKLDFLISVAAEEGGVFGLLPEERVRDRTESTSENSSEHVQRRPRSNTLEMYSSMRGRSDTIDFLIGSGQDQAVGNLDDVIPPDDNTSSGCVLDHLKALCSEPAVAAVNKTTGILRRGRHSSGAGETSNANTVTSPRAKFEDDSKRARANSDHTNPSNSAGSSSQRLVMEALQHFENEKRDRNDSWGGMSDLSMTGIAATHDALKSTGIIDDLMAAAADIGDDIGDELSEEPPEPNERKRTGSGGTNSLSGKGRPRLDSLASLSLASLSDASISVSGRKEQYASELVKKLPASETKPSDSTPGSQSIVVDYDAITAAVHAANAATEGLDLNSILSSPSATKLSTQANNVKPTATAGKAGVISARTSASKPAFSAAKTTKQPPVTKFTPKTKTPLPNLTMRPTPKSATMVKPIQVKSQETPKHLMKAPPPHLLLTQSTQKSTAKRALPLRPGMPPPVIPTKPVDPKSKPPVPSSIDIPIPKSTKTKAEMEDIMKRARAAAGYVPPPPGAVPPFKAGPMPYAKMPPRKAPEHYHLMPPLPPGSMPIKKRPNGPHPAFVRSMPLPPPGYVSRSVAPRPSSLQSQQKWDDMFEYLVKFIEETRIEQTKDLTEEQKAAWVWDGNVPTNYKTKCGKALGRWINNQRTSKTKGTLKDDREVRLVSTGLKWSVLTTNSWNEMLRELEIYAEQKRQGGKVWDGNVPTNYKITVERIVHGRKMEEEKNLGRWVNRQRSLYQAGKLKEDRQAELERVGLKWSVLLLASWSSMYESLCKYAQEQRAENNGIWDGNVPANWRVDSKPPINLGRWVNRQRCAYAKGRLKQEYVLKLEQTGLKWSVHDQKKSESEFDEDDFEGEEFIPKGEYQGNVNRSPEPVLSSIRPSHNGVARTVSATKTFAQLPPKLVTTPQKPMLTNNQPVFKSNNITSSFPPQAKTSMAMLQVKTPIPRSVSATKTFASLPQKPVPTPSRPVPTPSKPLQTNQLTSKSNNLVSSFPPQAKTTVAMLQVKTPSQTVKEGTKSTS